MCAPDIDAEEREWIETYQAKTKAHFEAAFRLAGSRFAAHGVLLERFDEAVATMLERGRSFISGVDEAHNELCVANRLLANTDPVFSAVEYEPKIPGCAKTIDFRAQLTEGSVVYVDVKTIKPKATDRWNQYQRALREDWFPDNVRVTLARDWMGGEIWHGMFTARARMMEHTRALEAKIREGELLNDHTCFVLMFCGDGYHWHKDWLEDFVSFYQRGRHRADDAFSIAESKDMEVKGIILDRTITRFGCMFRRQFETGPHRLDWDVQPPRDLFS